MARTAKLKVLTDKAVKAYMAGTAATPLHDGGGLYLRKREAAAYWYLRLTDPASKAQQWHRMFPEDAAGHYPFKTLADAREEAGKLWRQRSEGNDPRAARKQHIAAQAEQARDAAEQDRRRITVRDLFDHWARVELAPHVRSDGKRSGRKDGGDYIRQQFERRIFGTLGTVAVANVRKADVLALLDEVTAAGKLRTANVLLAALKQMFRFALARDMIERNPLDTITKRDAGGSETERERTLTADEITALAAALPAARMNARSVAAIWLILATGARVGEAMNADWANVDLDAGTWHLPETKNGRDHTIHLSAFALAQFTALAALKEDDDAGKPLPWVFPNTAGTGPVCIKSFGKQLADRQRPPEKRLQHRSKNTEALSLPGGRWTAHDLRRTAATLMADLGISGDVIDECLNHVIESRVRRTYVRNRRPAEQARAFDALGARLAALVRGEAEQSNVIALEGVRAA
ncbi:tyrosine-type recombinase/integrase [Roseateles toxinivorans]|uniref:Site-specific recombinase XerD n=1 Tax=Roseateles toxinivorans TaxID=270368 RepID=A0A4R6QUE3_9BURK|nr:site-specific integrase [Roseateles toxinivorans]TDP74135.1 site-specific recombinase XerD [Roseateles toxinivorans]